jgi:hypothetical protein
MNTTTRREQNGVALSDELERCDRYGMSTAEDDVCTESLLDRSVFWLPTYAMRGVGE